MGDIRETLDTSEKMICKVLNEINDKNDLNASNLELLGEATDALKDIYSIREKMEGGGSYERYMPIYMGDGYGRRRRDSMGRFMDDGYDRGYNGYDHDGYNRNYRENYNADYGNYRADNYGHSKEEEKEFLRWKMQNATNEQERESIRRKLEQM
jgi:hypothetical protein